MRLRLFPSLFLTVLIIFSIVLACRKLDSQVIKSPEAFSVNVAKEWWYGTFRKSGDYSKTDFSSPLAPPEGSSTKKYPRWKHAISYSIGGLQIVELPLEYETNSILLPGMQNLYNTPEGARIAQSAIHKLLLIKKRNGAIVVRTVTLVPKPKYAKKLYYDLSSINLQKLPADFSGYQMIGGWDESMKNIIEYSEGKGIRRVKMFKRKTTAQREALQSQARSNGNCLECEIWVPKMLWVCAIAPSGDDVADQERCQENGNWVASETEGNCQYDFNCTDDDPDPYADCLATGSNEEECACRVYMIGCDDDGGGGGDDGNGDNPDENQGIIDSLQGYPCAQEVLRQLPNINEKTKEILQNVFGINEDINIKFKPDPSLPASTDGETDCSGGTTVFNCTVRLNTHVISNSSMDYMVATFIHEALHAYIMYKRTQLGANSTEFQSLFPIYGSYIGNDPQHNTMTNQYIGMMADVIKAFNPSISDADARKLAWGGLEMTTLWSSQDTAAISTMNNTAKYPTSSDYTNHNLKKCE